MNSKDDKPATPEPVETKSSGRVSHDARGNPVWEWQTSTGVFGKDVSTSRLKKLEAQGLSLMDTQTVVKHDDKGQAKSATKAAESLPEGAINPYDNGSRHAPARAKPKPEFDASKHHPALAHKQKAMRKEADRQSLQSKHRDKTPAKPTGLLNRIKSVFSGK